MTLLSIRHRRLGFHLALGITHSRSSGAVTIVLVVISKGGPLVRMAVAHPEQLRLRLMGCIRLLLLMLAISASLEEGF